MKKYFLFLFLGAINLNVGGLYGKTLFVKGLWGNLLESPGGNKLLQIPRGSEVVVIKDTGGWVEVTFRDRRGYLPQGVLGETKPPSSPSLLGEGSTNILSKSRMRASQFTSAASARGLRQSSYDFSKSQYRPNMMAVKKMESWKVPEKVGWNFVINQKEERP